MSSSPQKNVREPSETEAWKLMMDSMIKFISASTKLMNTITARMETTPAPVKNSQEGECEAECVECPTRSAQECRECSAAMLLNGQKCEQPRNSSDAKGSPPSVDVAAVGTGEQRAEEGEKEPKDVGVAVPEPLTEEVEKPSESSEKICVCNELKQIKAFVKSGENVEQKQCTCCSAGRKGGQQNKEGKEITLCACNISPAEQQRMKNDLANKLHQAQQNLIVLQKQMVKLQRLEAGKASQSAALYKEIMKDNTLDRKTLSKTKAVGSNTAMWQQQNRSGLQAADTSARNSQPKEMTQYENPCNVNNCSRKQSTQDAYSVRCDKSGDPSIGEAESAPYIYSAEPVGNFVMPAAGHGEYTASTHYRGYSKQSELMPQQFADSYYTPEVTEKSTLSLQIEESNSYNVPSELDQAFICSPHNFYTSCPGYSHCRAFSAKQRMQTSSGQRLSGFQFSGTTAGVAQPSARTTSGQRSLGVRLRIRSKASADSSFVTPKRPIPSVQPLVSKTQKGWRQLPASSSQVPINVMQPSAMGKVCSDVCYNSQPQTDYMNPAFVTESQEYIGAYS